MRVLFCKVSSMRYYKGHCADDIPQYGGAYVDENGYGNEEFNFLPTKTAEDGELMCLGFVEPKSNGGKRNTLHIEKISGCEGAKDEPSVDDVLVVWCATRNVGEKNATTVVGWYKHATVMRDLADLTIMGEEGEEYVGSYNIYAEAKNCTLLPEGYRNEFKWHVPTAKYTKAHGFGQAMVWYPVEPSAKDFLDKLIANIENYKEENWINKYPEGFGND